MLPVCYSNTRFWIFFFFFFNDTATTEIYTLSLHDALPISSFKCSKIAALAPRPPSKPAKKNRSEEHTSELQSPDHLVCRLLLEKKKPMAKHSSQLVHANSPTLIPTPPLRTHSSPPIAPSRR